jgi:hypothetical protein
MTSSRITANRRNARKSTGPRSTAGKRAAASNALRHGLNVAIPADMPAVAAVARELSDHFARPQSDRDVIETAQAIVSYERIKEAYFALCHGIAVPLMMRPAIEPVAMTSRADDSLGLLAIFEVFKAQIELPDGAKPLSVIEFTRELERLARYERRAYSARKKALQRLGRQHQAQT